MTTAVQDRLTVTVEDAKTFLRVDHDADDTLIDDLLEGAKANADAFLNNPFVDVDGDELPIPSPVRVWVLRRVAAQYENRLEGVRLDAIAGIGSVDYGTRVGDGGSADFTLLRAFRLNPGL